MWHACHNQLCTLAYKFYKLNMWLNWGLQWGTTSANGKQLVEQASRNGPPHPLGTLAPTQCCGVDWGGVQLVGSLRLAGNLIPVYPAYCAARG